MYNFAVVKKRVSPRTRPRTLAEHLVTCIYRRLQFADPLFQGATLERHIYLNRESYAFTCGTSENSNGYNIALACTAASYAKTHHFFC